MLSVLSKIGLSMFIFLLIVTIHELGHYLLGRIFNLKIQECSMGILAVKFLPRLIDKRNTIWRIGLLPIGGYVKFVDNPALDHAEEEEFTENLFWASIKKLIPNFVYIIFDYIKYFVGIIYNVIADPVEIEIKKIKGVYISSLNWVQKIFLAAAGPVFNFILAYFLLWGTYAIHGREMHTHFIDRNDQIGFMQGDQLISAGGRKPINAEHLRYLMQTESKVTIIRQGNLVKTEVKILPKFKTNTELLPFSVPASMRLALSDTLDLISYTMVRLTGFIFNKRAKAPNLSGPIGIFQRTFNQLDKGFWVSVKWVAILSISLGALNLLIIPPFDGSVIVLALIESIFGKSRKLESAFNEIALLVVLGFMVVTMKNDLLQKQKPAVEQIIQAETKENL